MFSLKRDEDGGVPAVHVTEILGASQLDINQALAAGVLAYTNEPKSGTMSQVNLKNSSSILNNVKELSSSIWNPSKLWDKSEHMNSLCYKKSKNRSPFRNLELCFLDRGFRSLVVRLPARAI